MSDGLDAKAIDRSVAALRALCGFAPFVGGTLAEILTDVIPNQRIERIAEFARLLDFRVSHLEREQLKSRLLDPLCLDFIEEGLLQTARSVTSDRRRYLANLIGRGILKEAANDVQVRFLVQLLEQVNDVEIIQLGYYNQPDIEAKNAYKKLHSHALERVVVSSEPNQLEGRIDQAFQNAYENHLVQLGLLEEKIETTWNGTQLKGDKSITDLGRLLLSYISDS